MESASVPSVVHDVVVSNSKEEQEKSYQRYREIIVSTFPQAIRGNAFEPIYQYQGFWYHSWFIERLVYLQHHLKAQPNQIMVASMPKCGTTWLKALTLAITTRTQFDDFSTTHPLLTASPHECLPFLEADAMENPNPQLFATHIPYTSLPESIISSGCRIVYICRNPKDAFVSMWHFESKLKPEGQKSFTLEQSFEQFCKGVHSFGPFWDHILGYWKASLEKPGKFFFLKYEDLKRDTPYYVRKLAGFLGHPFSLEEERDGVVEQVIQLCSFENLSNLDVNKTGKHRPILKMEIENSVLFRKGVVGDWKNYLTTEMSEQLDKITEQKLSGFGLNFCSLA